jgi:tricarballylate dehydrogenase
MRLVLLALLGCSEGPAVVVVGGGPAGLAAAVEAARGGAEVTLLEGEAELGGAARWAAGITWAPAGGEAAAWEAAAGAPSSARERYIARVRPDVIEGLGVAFRAVPDPSGEGATLLAPVGGGRGLVTALSDRAESAGVQVRTGCRVVGLARSAAGWAVDAGACGVNRGDRVVLATGGFMGDLDEARVRLGLGSTQLLRSAPAHADGNGLALAAGVGTAVPDTQAGVIYAHAVPAPHDASVALMVVETPRDAVVVDATGARQDSLLAVRGEAGRALLDLPGQRAWLIGTAGGLGRKQAMPLEGPPVPLSSVARVHGTEAADLQALAKALGMLPGALDTHAFVPGAAPGPERPLPPRGPFIAVPLQPSPAKSLGGAVADAHGRALGPAGAPVPGLYLAGELIGFGDPYGAAPRDSTMVAGAVLSGQAAGRVAATDP